MKALLLTVAMFFVVALSSNAADVELSWDAVQHPAVTGYMIYYSGSSPDVMNGDSESPIDNGASTSIQLDNLPGDVYYFAATAYSDTGQESSLSEITCTKWMPRKIYPSDGATNIPLNIEFGWTQPSNPEDYTFTVYYGPVGGSITEVSTVPISLTTNLPPSNTAIIFLSLALLSMLFLRKVHMLRGIMLCSISALILTSCGGGGGGSDEYSSVATSLGGESSPAVLEPNTTYAWKVVADDGAFQTESLQGTFTTGEE